MKRHLKQFAVLMILGGILGAGCLLLAPDEAALQREKLSQTDFRQGVVALNTNKAEYVTGETVHFSMAVLNTNGNMICDASMSLTVKNRNSGREEHLSVDNGLIQVNPECSYKGPTSRPDYESALIAKEPGHYEVIMEVKSTLGTKTLHDQFTVKDRLDFEVERISPTRLFPAQINTMKLRIRAEKSFSGRVAEVIPIDWKIVNLEPLKDRGKVYVVQNDKTQEIIWDLSFEAGREIMLSYAYQAPNHSPAFYAAGPLILEDERRIVYEEPRLWKIASDAVGQMIALWDDGASIPSGWTCISCSGGDPYLDKFAKGAATYGGTGGADTHNHTASWVSSSNPGGAANVDCSPAEVAVSARSHTHNSLTGQTIGSTSSLPAHRTLRVIRYNSTGEPATLPDGLIAIFDAAAPAGWTSLSGGGGSLNAKFFRGADTIGNAGADTHTHSVSITTGAPSATTTVRNDNETTLATSTHTHTGASTTASGSNLPPYIEVIFAQLDSDSAPTTGMITMWNDTQPANWTSVSGVGGDFNGQFVRGAASYNDTSQGASTHNHANLGVVTGVQSATVDQTRSDTECGSAPSHTHTITVSFDSISHEPAYVEAIFAKRTSNPAAGLKWRVIIVDNTTIQNLNTGLERRIKKAAFRAKKWLSGNDGKPEPAAGLVISIIGLMGLWCSAVYLRRVWTSGLRKLRGITDFL